MADQNARQTARRPWLDRVLDPVEAAVEALALAAFAVMMLVTLLQVLNRFVLHIPMPWTEELARILFVSAMMIGIALATRRGEHIAVDFLLVKAGPGLRAGLGIGFSLGILFFLAIWLRGALRLAEVNAGVSFVTLRWLGVADVYRLEAAALALTMLFVLIGLVRQAGRLGRGAP